MESPDLWLYGMAAALLLAVWLAAKVIKRLIFVAFVLVALLAVALLAYLTLS